MSRPHPQTPTSTDHTGRRVALIVVLAIVTIAATACAAPIDSDDGAAFVQSGDTVPFPDHDRTLAADEGDGDKPTTTYVLSNGTVNGAAFQQAETSQITLNMHATGVSGHASCNRYNAAFSGDGGFPLDAVAATRMLCPEDVMSGERAFLEALAMVTEATTTDTGLVLAGPGVELTFTA